MAAHDINLRDPAVARLMGNESGIVSPASVASGKREMVQIAGDMDHGLMSTTRLDLGKHEVIVAEKDHLLTVDVYAIVGEPLKIHLICPRCKHQLTISGERKAIEYDPMALSPLWGLSIMNDLPREYARHHAHGKLSVEMFQCTWELEDEARDKGDVHIIAGGSLCRYRAAIDRNVLKEA
jgi:hypothetical protein